MKEVIEGIFFAFKHPGQDRNLVEKMSGSL